MYMNMRPKDAAFIILNGKKVNFQSILAEEFPVLRGVDIFRDRNLFLLYNRGFLFICTNFLGTVKNSYFTIDGKQGTFDDWRYGKIQTQIQDLKNFKSPNPVSADEILNPLPVLVDTIATDPASWLAQWHHKRYKKPPIFSKPYPVNGGWEVQLCVDFDTEALYSGSGQNQVIARREAALAAIEYLVEIKLVSIESVKHLLED
jgi:hypothetical protein